MRNWRRRSAQARVEVFERLRPSLPLLAPLDIYSAMRAGMALLPDGETLTDALRLIAAPAVLTPAVLRLQRGEPPIAPDPHGRPCRRHAAHADRHRRVAGAGQGARHLSGDRLRPRPQRLDLRRARGRLDAGRPDLGGAGRARRAQGPAARRRARPGDRHAGRDRGAWRCRRLAARRARARRAPHGLRPSHLPGARSARRRAEGGACGNSAARAKPAAGWPSPRRSSRPRSTCCGSPSRRARCRPMSSSTPRCCWRRWAFRQQAFSNVFAAGRVAGWIAHAREQQTTGRLIRPQSRYVGPVPDLVA